MKLAGKTAIITGGGRDIGAAAAKKLAAEGANVALSYFESSQGADTVVAEITAAGGKAIAVQADLNVQEGVDKLVKATVDTYGAIDVLVNNAGGSGGTQNHGRNGSCPLEHGDDPEPNKHVHDDQGVFGAYD